MLYMAERFEPCPDSVVKILRILEDDWRITIPGDAINPIPWLEQYGVGTMLPVYPEPGSDLSLVAVLVARTLDGADAHVMAALIPTAEIFQQLLSLLVYLHDAALSIRCTKIPLVGVFFTLHTSILRERDPELFT